GDADLLAVDRREPSPVRGPAERGAGDDDRLRGRAARGAPGHRRAGAADRARDRRPVRRRGHLAVDGDGVRAARPQPVLPGHQLVFVSNALVPLDQMPPWLASLAAINPMTYAIGAVRTLVLQGFLWGPVLSTAAFLAAFDAAMLALAVGAMRWMTLRGGAGL